MTNSKRCEDGGYPERRTRCCRLPDVEVAIVSCVLTKVLSREEQQCRTKYRNQN